MNVIVPIADGVINYGNICHGIYYDMLCHVSYQLDNLRALEAGKDRLLKEIPKLLREWPHNVDRPAVSPPGIETWLNDNCNDEFKFTGPVFRGDDYEAQIVNVLFKDETDAMAFKLAWS